MIFSGLEQLTKIAIGAQVRVVGIWGVVGTFGPMYPQFLIRNKKANSESLGPRPHLGMMT